MSTHVSVEVKITVCVEKALLYCLIALSLILGH
jgi:hypothetical protein